MTEGGFFERKTGSPSGLVIVITLHAAALGALALVKGPEMFQRPPVIRLINIPPPPPEPVEAPPPEPRPQRPQEPSMLDRPDPIVQRPVIGPSTGETELADIPRFPPVPDGPLPRLRQDPPAPPPPVRTAAEVDPRFAGALQPPYPTSEIRADREGMVRVRVTIGTDGRVKAIERLSATSDAFWAATERHARARWRFRPATVNGRPVESVKTMNVQFELRV